MKNKLRLISKLFILALTALSTVSCYDDFVENEFDYTAVYLPHESIGRTFIMGEGMQVGIGVVLGGRLKNNEDVEVTFSLDESLLDPGSALPESYYSLVDNEGNPANNKIIIPAGKTQGFVYVKADSINFLGDPVSLGHSYALGFRLDNVVNADSILVDLQSTKITFNYINQLYGNYIQKGQYVENDGIKDTIITYKGTVNDILDLEMLSPTSLQCNGIDNLGSSDKLIINIQADNSIIIEAEHGVTDDGDSFYNPVTREIQLNYSFESRGVKYKANDILVFRNRIVDNVNQFFELD